MLDGKTEKTSAAGLASGLVKTIWQLEEWVRDARVTQPSIYNFAVTDGQNIATVRYVSDPQIEPISLYFSKRGKYQCCDGKPAIVECGCEESGIIIASERLTEQIADWIRVAPNHVLSIDAQLKANVHLMPEV